MNQRTYMKGNEAIAIGALKAGLNAYFAYPITPSSEIPETLAIKYGNPEYPNFKVFLQAASEVEAINMVIGAAATGDKAMTATSSPGFSLKQEGLSYAAGMELPLLVVDINRGGPGLGNLGPEQSDYFQATKGGGHGNYSVIVLAPNSVHEMASFPELGFRLAFKYRNPVVILGDAFIGQLKEDIEFPDAVDEKPDISWATLGAHGNERHVINSLRLDVEELREHETHLYDKYQAIIRNEVRFESCHTEDADVVFVAYGVVSRICKAVVNTARERGVKAGLFRPITLHPFPYEELRRIASRGTKLIDVELNFGQMLYDVRLAVEGRSEVAFLGKWGGVVPTQREAYAKMLEVLA